jgi:vacuolar iron transporter family protein
LALRDWLASTPRDFTRRQIATGAEELEQVPEEEQEELSLIYQAKGLPEDLAKSLAERLIANKRTALDTLVREELHRRFETSIFDTALSNSMGLSRQVRFN